MTGEEMERAIDFLLRSQANSEARIEQVNANLSAKIDEVDQRLGARIEETNRQLGETNRQLGETNRQIAESNRQIAESNRQIAESNRQLAELSQQFGEYANMQTALIQVVTRTFEAQAIINKRTDEKLNALIDTVNKMLSSGQGGTP